MEHVCAQTRPLFILLSERVFGNRVRTYVNSKGKIWSTNGSEEGGTCDSAITQDSEPNTPPTELFRPQNKLQTVYINVLSVCTCGLSHSL